MGGGGWVGGVRSGGGGVRGGCERFEPLPIILSEISHLQNCRAQNSKKGNNSKSII